MKVSTEHHSFLCRHIYIACEAKQRYMLFKLFKNSAMSSSVYATIASSSGSSSSQMQYSRGFVLDLCLANWNNFPSDLVRIKTPAPRCRTS